MGFDQFTSARFGCACCQPVNGMALKCQAVTEDPDTAAATAAVAASPRSAAPKAELLVADTPKTNVQDGAVAGASAIAAGAGAGANCHTHSSKPRPSRNPGRWQQTSSGTEWAPPIQCPRQCERSPIGQC